MMHAPWWWSHLSFALLLAATLVAVARKATAGKTRALGGERSMLGLPLVALAIGILLSTVPLGEVDLAGYLVALSGEFSFALLFYFSIYLFLPSAAPGLGVQDRDWNGLRWAWAVAGLALYASALSGRGPDLYGFGFGPALAWIALAGSAILAIRGGWLGAVLLLGVVGAWQLRLSGGTNFWDYAIDPFLFVGSLVQVIFATAAAVLGRSGTNCSGKRKLVVTAADNLPAAAS